MKIEKEAKIAVPTLNPIMAGLRRIGASLLQEVQETDLYLQGTDCPLKRGCALRLRRQTGPHGEKAFLTFKGPKQKKRFKTRFEVETQVGDFKSAQKIFSELGFTPAITVRKKRQIWTWKRCQICLDRVPPLGCFVEVEAPTEKEIESALRKLSLQKEPLISEGYARLLAKALPTKRTRKRAVL